MAAMTELKPVSNGLLFRLEPRSQIVPVEADWVEVEPSSPLKRAAQR
jgi:hypothetical protein